MIIIDYEALTEEFEQDPNRLWTGVPHDVDDDIVYPSFKTMFDRLFDNNASAEYSEDSPMRWEDVPTPKSKKKAPMHHISLNAAQANCNKVIIKSMSGITWTLVPESHIIKKGDVVWWEQQGAKFGNDWEHVINITMTNDQDLTEVSVYQTYGEPHGSWEWDIFTLTNPAGINYKSLPI